LGFLHHKRREFIEELNITVVYKPRTESRRIQMRKRLFIALILILLLVPLSIAAAKDKPLRFETTYSFAYGTAADDDDGRSLVWSGHVSGAFEGEMEWWMHFDPAIPADEWNRPTGITNHWEDAKWIIYPDGGGYIIGLEWGSTTKLPENAQKGAIWRANGIVTEASPEFEYLIDRPMHDGGEVDWVPFPHGTGRLHIN
jgi:hypothetical protein